MPPTDDSVPRAATLTCRKCGTATANPFSGTGGVCLRCAGERAFALGSDTPFDSLTPAPEVDAAESAVTEVAEAESGLPARIGPYDVIEELGRGGMGRVYAAQQRGLGRIVALKVLPVGPGAPVELEMRFLREAQTVARLRHPNIVAIHDSGRAAGHVYFSMDYLEGGDLARRLRERPFGPRESAALIAKVADALAVAHTEGVLHRDLKPSNILLDGDEPRLADFGLAAQLESSGDLTSASGVFGTPHYLAPEAVRGGAAALTAASDLYALGIVLYVMLTGRTPFAGASPAELPALIQENEPPGPRLLAPAVPADVETICLKCLERDPLHRYATATDLAEDLRRFLAGEPILARAPGRWDAAGKFARRHRVIIGAAGTVIVVLVGATAVSTTLAVRALRAERAAANEAATAKALADFLENDLLAQATPDGQADRNVTLHTVVDRAAGRIDTKFKDQPLVAAAIHHVVGEVYDSLGNYAVGRVHLDRSFTLRREHLGPEHPQTLAAMFTLATVKIDLGQYAEADALLALALAGRRRVLGASHENTLETANVRSVVLRDMGRLTEADALQTETLTLARNALPAGNIQTSRALNTLASIRLRAQRLPEAEALIRESVALQEKHLGPDHVSTLTALNDLGVILREAGKISEAAAIHERVLAGRRRILGPDHPHLVVAMTNLAGIYKEQGRWSEAETMLVEACQLSRQVFGKEHPRTLLSVRSLADTLRLLGRFGESMDLVAESVTTSRRTLGDANLTTQSLVATLADLEISQGKIATAEPIAREVLAAHRKAHGPDHAQTLSAEETLGNVLGFLGRHAEAEELYRHILTQREKTTPNHWRSSSARLRLASTLVSQARFADAEPLLLESVRRLQAQPTELPASARYLVGEALKKTAELYARWEKPSEAQRWQSRLAALKTP